MLEELKDLPAGVDGVRASGTVSREDYERVIDPMLAKAHRAGRRVRFLYQFSTEFRGFTPAAAWEDAKVGLRYVRLFDRCAVVADADWIRNASHAVGNLLPCPIKVFRNAEWDSALAWISAPSTARNVEHRIVEAAGVLVVEPHGRLSVEDFDAIAMSVDPWIEAGHKLRGVVIHAKAFPGWESIGSFLRHVRFVREHHRKIHRVALAADGKLAKLAPAIVETFISADVRHFAYGELDLALKWAGNAEPSERASGGGMVA